MGWGNDTSAGRGGFRGRGGSGRGGRGAYRNNRYDDNRYDRRRSQKRAPEGVHESTYNPDIDPFIQRLHVSRQPDGGAIVKMNNSQSYSIFGDCSDYERSNWRNNY